MTENRKNWLYPEAFGLYFPHDGFIMRASDGKQYDYEEECGLLNEYDKKYNEYRNDILRLEKENEQLKRQIGNLEHTRDFCADVLADFERIEKENQEIKNDEKQLSIDFLGYKMKLRKVLQRGYDKAKGQTLYAEVFLEIAREMGVDLE